MPSLRWGKVSTRMKHYRPDRSKMLKESHTYFTRTRGNTMMHSLSTDHATNCTTTTNHHQSVPHSMSQECQFRSHSSKHVVVVQCQYRRWVFFLSEFCCCCCCCYCCCCGMPPIYFIRLQKGKQKLPTARPPRFAMRSRDWLSFPCVRHKEQFSGFSC